jgi:hypothetical protein
MGAFGRASTGSAPRTKPGALPNGLKKQLRARSTSILTTLEPFGRGGGGALQKRATPRLRPAFCQSYPRWTPSGHGGCRGAGRWLAVAGDALDGRGRHDSVMKAGREATAEEGAAAESTAASSLPDDTA